MTRTPHPRHAPQRALWLALVSLAFAGGAMAQQAGTATGGAGSTASQPRAAGAQASKVDRSERRFVEKAAAGGMAEVQLGELARQKAMAEPVRQFAERMVQDHGKANTELKQVAATKGIELPAAPDSSHQRDMNRLQKLQGAEFDRAYMKHMLDDHRKDVGDFDKQARDGKDPEIKAFAQKTLPTLQEHLKLAQTTSDGLKHADKPAAKAAASSPRP